MGLALSMVQMHPTGVTFEAEGGIRNPACQDDDSMDCQQPQQQQQQRSESQQDGVRKKIEESSKIHEKSRRVMTVCRTRVPWRFSANFFIALLVLSVMGFVEFGLIPNQQIGFYCYDPKISYKFTGDSISAASLIATTIIVPAIVMWATEWSCYNPESYKSLECGSSSRSRQFWQWYGFYTLGYCYMLFIVESMKVIVGEPRPHFIDSCKPKELLNCTANEYRRLYTCTNTEIPWYYVNDSDKSFPSGHSALSVFMATYLVWYLQRRIPNRLVLILVKPWLQSLAVLWGVGCSMSRIVDNRHHWWDVAVGASIGLAFAVFVVRVLCKGFRGGRTLPAPAGTPIALEASAPNGQISPKGYASGNRHQSVKKLLSTSSATESVEGRELGDMPTSWAA